ncbi:hypothetical protein T11_11281 [Trichinella zimbabwensis]|uniref:Uncharacterized protein n=1 Tax=Trichinella zimbabwensis TaxID=268475 RepID=A0A0V1HFI7_9BILA|nr:hypothetical protein T11_11281 [Trichinella zimbabwensis]
MLFQVLSHSSRIQGQVQATKAIKQSSAPFKSTFNKKCAEPEALHQLIPNQCCDYGASVVLHLVSVERFLRKLQAVLQ